MKIKAVAAIIFAASYLGGIPRAHADYSVDLIRITCIPESGYFEVEHARLHGNFVFEGGSETIEERKKALEKSGFFDPRGLKTECQLGLVPITLETNQAEPHQRQCGAYPEITASLRVGPTTWLENVEFGQSCKSAPTVTRVSIGAKGGIGEVCIAPDQGEVQYCHAIIGPVGAPVHSLIPVNRSKLFQYVPDVAQGSYPRFR